jgi:hypothetical protein
MALNPKDTWYVAFDGPRTTTPGKRAVPRITKTFQTEGDAKEFARLKLAEGRTVNAGTINPYVPKRTVAAAEIHRWLQAEA